MATLAYNDFGPLYRRDYDRFGSCPACSAKTADGRTVELVKVDEEADLGYGYAVFLNGKEVCCRFFDGFGCLDRENDVLHTINEIL